MTEDAGAAGAAAAVADALADALTPRGADLVAWTARTTRAAFGAAACSIALLTDDGRDLVFTTASGGSADFAGSRMRADEGIAGWVATTGQAIAVSDLERDPRFAASMATVTGYLPTAILAAPIELDDRVLGVIEVLDRDATRVGSDDDLALLTLFGRQAAVALESAARSRRIGSLLVAALAEVRPDFDLSSALRALEHAGDGLGEVAAALAELALSGPGERRLAAAVLSAVADYARAAA